MKMPEKGKKVTDKIKEKRFMFKKFETKSRFKLKIDKIRVKFLSLKEIHSFLITFNNKVKRSKFLNKRCS